MGMFSASPLPTNTVFVQKLATGGSGTSGSPWTGWDTALVKASNTTYFFEKGYYSAASLIFDSEAGSVYQFISLIGEDGTVLKLSGSAAASGPGNFIPAKVGLCFACSVKDYDKIPQQITIKNIVIDGAGTARFGILFHNAWNILTENVRSRNLETISGVTATVANGTNPLFTTGSNHGFSVGQVISVAGMTGAGSTNANGTWEVTETAAANTFKVGTSLVTTGTGASATVKAATIGMDMRWAIIGTHTNFSVSGDLEGVGVYTNPTLALCMRTNGTAGDYTTTQVFNSIRIDGVQDGILISKAANNVFNGGTTELNGGWGLRVITGASSNIFNGLDIEGNTTGDVYSWPESFSSSNWFNNIVGSNLNLGTTSTDVVVNQAVYRSAGNQTFQGALAGFTYITNTGNAANNHISCNEFHGGMAMQFPPTGQSAVAMGSYYSLTYTPSNGTWLAGPGPGDLTDDVNVLGASGHNINFGINISHLARLTSTRWDFYCPITTKAGAFSTAVATPTEGTIQAFTDSSTATWGATITGGGANHVLGYFNGTNWTVMAK